MSDIHHLSYGIKETAWLKSRDPILGAAMDIIGHIHRAVTPDLFTALVNTIVGQQISTKAQATIWQRMQARYTPMTPETIGALSAEELQSCGISFRKAFYIKEVTDSIRCGGLDLSHLQSLSDTDLCSCLSQIKGIGVWTAEMLMTFSLQRPNVMSWGDLAILRGLRMLYRHRKISRVLFDKYKRRYAPYATVASLYLWAIAGGGCTGLVDHMPKTEAQKKSAAKKKRKTQGKLKPQI